MPHTKPALHQWKGKFPEVKRNLADFLKAHVAPKESAYFQEVAANRRAGNQWQVTEVVEGLIKLAKAQGLWNLFLPSVSGLTQHEYAQLAEMMGWYPWAVEAFNCDAPDTGNMETLHLFGSPEQKAEFLVPLLDGRIRSAFAMTEPDVASSDASNIATTAKLDESTNEWVINGSKWWTSGFGHPRCEVLIVMCRTAGKNEKVSPHQQHSMILVPRRTPGVVSVRPLTVFGDDDAPHGHFEIRLENVRVPAANILVGPGKGFAIAQGRLGPGRIHHCMRAIGMADRILQLMVQRAMTRKAFGSTLDKHGMTQEAIALSRIEWEQARLLVLRTAQLIDEGGTKAAFQHIAMIKVAAPRMALAVMDRAIQVFGGKGVSDDVIIAKAYAAMRTLRIADGPDEVHLRTVSRVEVLRAQKAAKASKL